MIAISFFGTILGDPKILMYFALYFIVVASVVFTMLHRIFILRVVLFIISLVKGTKKNDIDELENENERSTGEDSDRSMTPIIQVTETLEFLKYFEISSSLHIGN